MATEISMGGAHSGRRDGIVLVVGLAAAAGFAVSYSPLAVLAGVAAVAALLVITARVEYFVFFIALYTPFEEFVLKWLPDSAYMPARYAGEALLPVMLLVVLSKGFLKTGRIWKSSPLDPPLALLFTAAFFSTVLNDVPSTVALFGMKNIVRYVLLFYIVYNAGLSEKTWKTLVYCLLAVAALESLIGLSQFVVRGEYLELFKPKDVMVEGETIREAELVVGKALGTLGRYNVLGNFLNICLCLGLGLYYAGNERHRTFFAVLFGVILSGIAVSFSRMSWLGAYLALVFILLIQKKKTAIIYIVAPVLATALLLVSYQGLHWYKGETGKASPVERYVSIFSTGYIEKSMRFDRLFALFVTAPAVLKDYPLLGVGPGTFASEVTGGGTSARGVYPEHSHEYWLGIRKKEALQYTSDQGWVSVLCQVGLMGLFALVWVFHRMFRLAHTVFRRHGPVFERGVALGFMAFVALLVFQNFISFNLTYRAVSLYFWLFAGYIATLETGKPEDGGIKTVA